MTPKELLAKASALVEPMLLLDDEDKLKVILYKALGEFQSRVGSISELLITAEEAKLGKPVSFIGSDVVMVLDQTEEVWPFYVEGGLLFVKTNDRSLSYSEHSDYCAWPCKVQYLENLRELNYETGQIPRNAIQMSLDYLKVLLDIANAPRLNAAYENSQLTVEFLPQLSELKTEKENLEIKMSEMASILPAVSVFD